MKNQYMFFMNETNTTVLSIQDIHQQGIMGKINNNHGIIFICLYLPHRHQPVFTVNMYFGTALKATQAQWPKSTPTQTVIQNINQIVYSLGKELDGLVFVLFCNIYNKTQSQADIWTRIPMVYSLHFQQMQYRIWLIFPAYNMLVKIKKQIKLSKSTLCILTELLKHFFPMPWEQSMISEWIHLGNLLNSTHFCLLNYMSISTSWIMLIITWNKIQWIWQRVVISVKRSGRNNIDVILLGNCITWNVDIINPEHIMEVCNLCVIGAWEVKWKVWIMWQT